MYSNGINIVDREVTVWYYFCISLLIIVAIIGVICM